MVEMTLRDRVRYFFAKIFFQKTILFSKKNNWELEFRDKIKDFIPFFYDFNKINPNYFDYVFPLSIDAERYINRHENMFRKQSYFIPSDLCIDLCNDKEKFHKYLVENCFAQYVPKINETFDYPYILKKKVGSGGRDIVIIHDLKNEMENKNHILSEKYFTQEYIVGNVEYTTHIIFKKNKIVFFKTFKFIFDDIYFIKGKKDIDIVKEEVNHKEYKSIFEEILLSMDYQGICCFNYKITSDGMKIFEINPRYGGSLKSYINEVLISYSGSIEHFAKESI